MPGAVAFMIGTSMDAQDSRLTEEATALTCRATRTSAADTKGPNRLIGDAHQRLPGVSPEFSADRDEFPLMIRSN